MKSFYIKHIAAALQQVLILSSFLPAQTNISGPVSGVWNLAGSPYLIVGDATVPAGNTLQIEAGVSVQFTGEYLLEVFGNIQAIGNPQDSIAFAPAGTGMYTKGLHLVNGQDTSRLKYCIFTNFRERTDMGNGAFRGGALYGYNACIVIFGCSFRHNTLCMSGFYGEGTGGAVSLEYCTGTIASSAFISNTITCLNQGLEYFYGMGGAIYAGENIEIIHSSVSQNLIEIFTCNEDFYGSESYALGGGIYSAGVVRDTHICDNSCEAYAEATSWYMPASCWAESLGGGVFGAADAENNMLASNRCISEAIGHNGADAFCQSQGGGIYLEDGQIIHCDILNNLCSGMYVLGTGVCGGTVSNSILYGNTIAAASATYSCTQTPFPGTGNIAADPLFVAGPGGDYYLSQPAAGQTQQSPCVDAGDPAAPLFRGTTRTDGFPDIATTDMGYHYPCPYDVARLNIKVMLQGPYTASAMQTSLNNNTYLPLSQPYQGAPWNYSGAEVVTAIPNALIVDWVLLELRQAPEASQALPGTMLCRQACFVNNTGRITGLDGDESQPVVLTMPQVLDPGNSLFIIVWHRNHLGVLSAEPMQVTGLYTYSYDFTTGAAKAYGGVNGHIEVGQGIWGMVSGDGDANGQVNNADKVDVWKPQGGFSGYRAGDFNMDGQVDNQDKIDQWAPNSGRSCQVVMCKQPYKW